MPTYLSPGVYVEEVDSGSRPIEGVGTAVAAFVGLAEDGPFNAPTLVPNWTQYVRNFGGFVEGSYLAHSVYAYFQNGGGNCYVVRIGTGLAGNGGGRRRAIAAGPQAHARHLPGRRARRRRRRRARITVEVHGVEGDAPEGTVQARCPAGRSGPGGVRPAEHRPRQAQRRHRGQRHLQGDPDRGDRQRRRRRGARPRRDASACTRRRRRRPCRRPDCRTDDYVGDVAERTGFSGLEAIDEITMVCVPDLMSAYQQGAIDLETVQAVQLGDDRALRADGRPDRHPRPAARTERPADQGMAGRQGRLRLEVRRAVLAVGQGRRPGIGQEHLSCRRPASWPASGAATTTPAACTRPRRTRWSAARSRSRSRSPRTSTTCSTRSASTASGRSPAAASGSGAPAPCPRDPAWRYLNVRRLFNYLEESILNGTHWVVFEPNDDALWAKIRRTISAFLVNEWRKGALFGLTPDEAFYVKCDRETNPAEGIDAGQVLCEIGVAPVKPAEFVIFRLSQFSGGTSLVAE